MFAKRTDWEFHSNQITLQLDVLKQNAVDVIDLTESNPTRCGFVYPSEKILNTLSDPANLSYQPHPQGMLCARQAVSQYYQRLKVDIDPEKIFLTASTSEAYSYLFRLLADPGDHILIAQPGYPLFQFLADINDLHVDFYSLAYEDGWHIDFETIENQISKKTRVLILVNPNNPTGSYIKKDELTALNHLCQKHHIAMICDEVFFDYPFEDDQKNFLSLAHNRSTLTFTLSGISKILALPQMKIGWIVVGGPEDQVQESLQRLEVISDTFLSVSTPAQNALPQWFSTQEKIQKELKYRTAVNRSELKKMAEHFPQCRLLEAEGGWYAILKIPGIKNEEQWVLELLNEGHVYVHPGYFFDFEDEPCLVLSLLTQPQRFQEGIKRIFRKIAQSVS